MNKSSKHQDLAEKWLKEHYSLPLDKTTFEVAVHHGIDVRKSAVYNFAKFLDSLETLSN